MTIWYVDGTRPDDSGDGASWATAKKTITGVTAAMLNPGDTVKIAKSPDPTSLGQTALWTNLSRDVVLQTGPVTAEIDNCESTNTNWVKSASITGSDDTAQYKLGSNSLKLSVAAAFTTGKAAYRDFGAGNEKDLSSYQQISFWIRNFVAIPNAGDVKIKLCADASGNTPVDTFSLPAIPSAGQWVPITIDKGAALGSSIRSIAVYVDTDFGAIDMSLDNIIACKAESAADSLTLQSLISKNSAAQGGTEPWYCIQSINGTTIKIDNHTNRLGNGGRGYTGTTETVTIYKRETIKTAMVASGDVQAVQDSGTASAYIEFQGGYNTSSGLQDGMTFWDGLNGAGNGLNHNMSFIDINQQSFVRYQYPFPVTWGNFPGVKIRNGEVISCGIATNHGSGSAIDLINMKYINSGDRFRSVGEIKSSSGYVYIFGNITQNYQDDGGYSDFNILKCINGPDKGIVMGAGRMDVKDLTTADNTVAGIGLGGRGAIFKAKKTSIGEGTPVSFGNNSVFSYVSFGKWGGVAGANRIYKDMGTIISQDTTRHTASGLAWQLSPNANANVIVPLFLPVAQAPVNANAEVTVKAWLRRSNTGLAMSLVCRGGQIAGVDSDVTASMTAAADTWEEVTITFTPTEAGVVEIEVWAYGGTTYSGYVDDMSASQSGGPVKANLLTLDYSKDGLPWCHVPAGAEAGGGGVFPIIGGGHIIKRAA